MNFTDYYKELELDKGASESDIKKAFRRLARQYHPDANPNDPQAEEKFKRISEAYDVLSDPQKKAKYDQFSQGGGFQGRPGSTPGGFPGGGRYQFTQEDFGDMFQGTSFGDLLSQLFGQGERAKGRKGERARGQHGRGTPEGRRGTTSDERVFSVTLSLEEAFTGVTKRLAVGDKKLDVTFKPGVIHGHRMKIPVGVLEVAIAPHKRYEREGNDVKITEHVPLTTALLGGEHRVQTLSGTVTIKIPAGSASGKTMRLRGMGMPLYEEPTKRGDMFVALHVEVPQQLTDEQRALVEQLRLLGL